MESTCQLCRFGPYGFSINIVYGKESILISNKVVARFKDNTIMKGTTTDFFPNKTNFHLTLSNGEIVDISIE